MTQEQKNMHLVKGCQVFNISKLSDMAVCPFQASRGEAPLCARWGSGTPLVSFQKGCTVADLKECPLEEYPNEVNLVFWTYWLWLKGKLKKHEALSLI